MTPVQLAWISLFATAGAAFCPPAPDGTFEDDERYAVQLERSWAVLRTSDEQRSVVPPPEASSNPGVEGAWLAPQPWEVIAIHSAVLPTGEVLQYSRPDGGEGSRARLWNPATGAFTNIDWMDDIFCSGMSHMSDGTIYLTGGNDDVCDSRGIRDTNMFDPFSGQWTELERMQRGRWYPTNVVLPDGRVLIFSGLDHVCDWYAEVELFTPGKGLELVPEGFRYVEIYPRMHLLSSGQLAHVGPERIASIFELGIGWTQLAVGPLRRGNGTSVLIPGRTDEVMVIGGEDSGAVHASCEILDFSKATVEYRPTGFLNHARAHADALILPDKTVLVMGGGQDSFYGAPVFIPEQFDPDTETWTELAPHVHGRMYHATTVLLPDGRVLVSGQDHGDSAFMGEIYMPPYLFRGERPTISSAPPRVFYGRSFTVETPDAGAVTSAVLLRLSAVTHSVNFGQRLVDLSFTNQGDGIRAAAPASPTLAPPGYYMLFILDENEVPSIAQMVRVTPWIAGDANNDGVVDFGDIVALLAGWGDCPPPPIECPADANDDGVVNFEDLLLVLGNWS